VGGLAWVMGVHRAYNSSNNAMGVLLGQVGCCAVVANYWPGLALLGVGGCGGSACARAYNDSACSEVIAHSR
jgi:hypothetical protein